MTRRDPVFNSDNLARWNEVAGIHARSPLYRVPQVVAGTAALSTLEREALGDVSGRVCLHLMCHIGTDAVILARSAAAVVGVDYSIDSLSVARDLAARAGSSNLSFVAGDVHSPPLGDGLFDVVFMNWGSLVWIFDMTSVLTGIQRMLRPGGRVVIVDQHPSSMGFRRSDDEALPLRPAEDYFGPRCMEVERLDYTDKACVAKYPKVTEARHTLAALLGHLRDRFRIVRFTEHPCLGWQAYLGMVREEATLWRLPRSPVPLSFVVEAESTS